jgi:hypothetical protein
MRVIGWAALVALAGAGPVGAQVKTIDPNTAIDGDLRSPPSARRSASPGIQRPAEPAVEPLPENDPGYDPEQDSAPPPVPTGPAQAGREARAQATLQAGDTYDRDDLLAAGEGVFGKGAAGLAGLLEKVLRDQGQPNAYIAGREAAGAFVVGVRYGSGVMNHKVEGQRPVYWTGPSLGFDVGGDADKVFVLVYNLYDGEDLFKRFPAAEGRLYAVGGFAASYLRRGKVVLIPVRLGVGWRAGVNVGYMRFTKDSRWLPF